MIGGCLPARVLLVNVTAKAVRFARSFPQGLNRTLTKSYINPIILMSSTSNTTSAPSNFEALFSVALTEYTKRTGKDLRDHPLASRINSCDDAESIVVIFQEQAQAFEEFRRGDTKLFEWLRPVVNVLHALSTNEALGHGASHVRPATFCCYFSSSQHFTPRCFLSQRRSFPVSASFYP